ncbi:MAG: glycogen/starch/alpha-glucan phosphorylase [Erysipelotrichaceae bacterium]
MFKNRSEFVGEFTERIEQKYGRPVVNSHITERYMILGDMVRDYASVNWKQSKAAIAKSEEKQMYYFSMEFLIGRLLTNNLMNLGIYETVKEGLEDLNFDINELENMESDAGLGNGGLGRLAACFLDSLTSTGYAGHGNCIRYQYGMFKQKIEDGEQVEVPDQWLKLGNVWEVRKPKHAVDVKFWGRIEMHKDADSENITFKHVDCEHVTAVPYDVPVVGSGVKLTNTLRLWSAEASELMPSNSNFGEYINGINEICRNVYPDDTTESGKYLRLKQQYFFLSAGLQSVLKEHFRVYNTFNNLSDKVTIQMNDTHPVLVIPELMRILMDENGYTWDDAWAIVEKTVAYTNHTVLQEALERWPIEFIQRLLPRIYMIVEEINHRFEQAMRAKKVDYDVIRRMLPIRDGQLHMANLAIVASYKVNGVAELHTKILKEETFKDFYHESPEKFINKTNGITHRRWLLYSNPQLRTMLDEVIGTEYHEQPDLLNRLVPHIDDEAIQNRFLDIKKERKEILAKYILQETGIEVDVNSIFDVQAKRLHAYKRQLLNVMHIIYLYQRMSEDPTYRIHPHTFIFAAKAAPGYYFAKRVIKLIHAVAEKVNNDPEISKFMKVVFIPNYSVSIAEILMNAADVSEQISTAGKEASGTGNMKLMMNGAITLGTLDGANVEIHDLVGDEFDEIFGLRVEEVNELKANGYNAWEYYERNPILRRVVDSLIDGSFGVNDEFRPVYDELMHHNDEYLLLADFDAYVKAQRRVQARYADRKNWARCMLYNIARSGFFSSDRTIEEYAKEIWGMNKITVE